MTQITIGQPRTPSEGFDAPVAKLEDDFLNRAPLAREVYSVAVNGPIEWSVRIGVYGEWGSGKTTILEFVSSFAKQDDNLVVWFNPWEHESKESLWRAFVLKLYSEVEGKLGITATAASARRKSILVDLAKLVKPAAGVALRGADGAVGAGLDLLKGYFSFGSGDLKELATALGGKRILILIDDLDRAASALVPEILFALKEIMDFPSFSFICAFDPSVVGKVLRGQHRGFGDGLKFLEKIIDYPVWLPPATDSGLLKIALAERERHCPFIPEPELEHTLPLLAQNPRTVRQFIRVLSLLKLQIDRYYDHELRWPVVLASAVIRVRFPQLASKALSDLRFLDSIGMRNTYERRTDEGKKVDSEIESQIAKITLSAGMKLSDSEHRSLKECMRRICDQVNLWTGTGVEEIARLAHIVEQPSAVTLKEFDEFLNVWKLKQGANCVFGWIHEHAKRFHLSALDVAPRFVEYAINRYLLELRHADLAFHREKGRPHSKAAKSLLRLLEALLIDSTSAKNELSSRPWIPMQLIAEKLPALGDAVSPQHKRLWPRTRRLLLNLVGKWDDKIDTLVHIFQPFGHSIFAYAEGAEQKRVIRKMCDLIGKRFAKTVVGRFLDSGFIDSVRGGHSSSRNVEAILFLVDGPLWAGDSAAILRILLRAKKNRVVQENAYELLYWIGYLLKDKQGSEKERVSRFVVDPVAFPAVWAAAIAVPFAPRYVYQLREFPAQLKAMGVEIPLPPWWEPSLKEITFPKDENDEQSPKTL